MEQVIILSLTASLNPTLVGATTVMLLLPSPAKLMLGYLVGAYMTSITLGLVIVFSLSDSSATNTTQHTLSPAVDIALGGIALAAAFALHTGRHRWLAERRQARKGAKKDKGPPRWQRELSKGSARTTFVIGALLTLPGGSYLAGLDRIHKLKYSTSVTVLLVVGFNLVMLWMLELPLASFLVAPDLDACRSEACDGLGRPARACVRRARLERHRRTARDQGHHRADQLTPVSGDGRSEQTRGQTGGPVDGPITVRRRQLGADPAEDLIMRLGKSTRLSDSPELRFRISTIKTGAWLTFVVAGFIMLYAAETWGDGHRAALVVVAGVCMLANIALLTVVPFESIVAGRWRETFFMGWSIASVLAVLAVCLLDPLPRSPLALPLFMPLLFAGLSYPVRTSIAVSCVTVGGYLMVCLIDGEPMIYSALVLSSLAWTAAMCLWQAHNRKTAESERARLAAIVESSAEAIMSLSADGIIQSWNPAATLLYGYSAEEAIGQHLPSLLSCDPSEREPVLAAVFADGKTTQTEIHDVHKDGHLLDVSVTDSPIRDAEGPVVGIARIARDISERRLLEAERERIELELRISQRLEAVGQLAAGIAHEINTPVQFIGDSAHFLQEAVGDLEQLIGQYHAIIETMDGQDHAQLRERARAAEDAADLEYLRERVPGAFNRMISGIDRVGSIVKAMKTFGRVTDSDQQAPADLNEAIETTLVVAHNEYKYVAEVKTRLADLPPVVCNIGDINQVLLNLIVNAAHAIEDANGDTGQLGKITITTEAIDDIAVISVTDTGCGIPEDLRARVFDPFFTTKEVGRGTGQGLSLARAIIDRHAGSLKLASEVDHGTTFTVKLPVAGRYDAQGDTAPHAQPRPLSPPDLKAA